MINRRQFIRGLICTGVTTFTYPLLGAAQKTKSEVASKLVKAVGEKPVIIATWQHGLPASLKAWEILQSGGSGLDAVEKGINVAEDDPEVSSVGYGGLPDEDGIVTLDASIIDGPGRHYGSVAGLEKIRNPISVARKVMEETDHVMIVGDGARQFAVRCGFKEENLLTEKSRQQWLDYKKTSSAKDFWGKPESHDTIGLLVLDNAGNLFGGCSTSGLAYKIHGRVGDSPIIGAGLYVDNDVGAASATGRGEEVIKTCGTFLIVEQMRQGKSPQQACETALERIQRNNPARKDFRVSYIALNKDGDVGAATLYGEFQYAVVTKTERTMKSAKVVK